MHQKPIASSKRHNDSLVQNAVESMLDAIYNQIVNIFFRMDKRVYIMVEGA